MARKNWTHAAGLVWPILVEAGSRGKTLTYTELAQKIQTNPLSVGRALGPIHNYCLENRLAPLTAVVVGKNSGIPGNGFAAWDVDDLETALDAVSAQNWTLVGNPFGGFGPSDDEGTLARQLTDNPDSSREVYSKVRDRGIAQRIFRLALLAAYGGRCAACSLSFTAALEAAHILPWGNCKPHERLDVRNGLLLCASHHRMFDADVFTIGADFMMTYNNLNAIDGEYSEMDRAFALALHNQILRMPNSEGLRPHPDFLQRRAVP